MNEVFRLVATIKTNAKTAIGELKAVEKTGKTMGARLGKTMKTLAKVMKVVFVVGAAAATYAMGKFFVSSIKSAAQYEQAMAMVQAVTGATGEEFDALGEKAKELGKTTKFTMISIAEGMEALGRAGMTANEIIDSMAGVTALAASQCIELGQAAEMTAGALNGFNLAADQAGRVADVYAYAASNSAIRTEDLAETLKYAMPAANALGYSLEDVAGMAMILGDNMIKGSMAGTGLSFAFSELVGMSDEFQKKLGDVGVSVDDLTGPDGKILSMAEVLGVLKDKGLDAGDMFELFGKRAGKSMVILLGKGEDAIKDYTGALEECGGTAEEMAEIQLDTLSGQVEILRGSWELLKVTVGEKLIPILKDFVKGTLIPLINRMAEAAGGSDTLKTKFKAFIDKVKDGIEWIVEHRENLVKAIKAVTVGFAALVAIKAATWIAGVVTGLTGPVGLVVALIAAAAAMGLFVKKKTPEIAEAMGKISDVIKEATGGYIDLGVAASEAYRRAAEDAAALKDAMENLTPNMTAAFVMVGDLATETARMNEELERSEGASRKMGATILQAGQEAQTAYLAMKTAIEKWRASEEGNLDKAEEAHESFWDEFKKITENGAKIIRDVWSGLSELIGDTLGGMLRGAFDYFRNKKQAAEDHVERLLEIEEDHAERSADLQEQYQEDLVDAEEEYAQDRQDFKQDYLQEIKDIEEDSHRDREEAEERFYERLKDLETKHTQRSADLQTKFQDDLAEEDLRYHRKREDIERDYQRDLGKLKADDFEGRARIETRYAERIEDLDIEYGRRRTDIETDYNDDVEKENLRHQREQEKDQQDHVQNIEGIEKTSQEDRRKAEESFNEKIEKLADTHADKRETIEKDYTDAAGDLVDDRKEAIDDEVQAYEDSVKPIGEALWEIVKTALAAAREELWILAAVQAAKALAFGAAAALGGLWAIPIAAQHAAAGLAAGLEATALSIMGAITGFKEGALMIGPTVGVFGEGPYDEVALPLTPPILADIGKGIVSALQGVEPAYAGAGIGGAQVVIEEMHVAEGAVFHVREEADIERIAKELGDEFDDRIIGKGRVKP